MPELGRCDFKQYEHCGPHERIPNVGQRLPPFGCKNWQPESRPRDRSESEYPPPTPPVPPLPYRLGEWTWNPICTRYEATIFFKKVGARGKETEHPLGVLGLKDYFSHSDNPDFPEAYNSSELDYQTIGQNFIEAINREAQANTFTPAQLTKIRETTLDVIDECDPKCDCDHHQWHFFLTDETESNAARLDFCDEIARRLTR